MHGFVADAFGGRENSAAIQLFTEMDRLRRIWENVQPKAPMRRSEMFVLGTMAHLTAQQKTPVTVGQLARQMHQSMPGISQKVSVLEKQGYLIRVGDESDRRVVTVELTKLGLDTARDEMVSMVAHVEKALGRFGPEKTKELLSLMHELSDALAPSETAGTS